MISLTTITLDFPEVFALRDATKSALRRELSRRHDHSFSRAEVHRLITCLRTIRTALRPCS